MLLVRMRKRYTIAVEAVVAKRLWRGYFFARDVMRNIELRLCL